MAMCQCLRFARWRGSALQAHAPPPPGRRLVSDGALAGEPGEAHLPIQAFATNDRKRGEQVPAVMRQDLEDVELEGTAFE